MRKMKLAVIMLAVAIQASALTLDSCRTMARDNYPLINQYGLIQKSEQFSVENAARSWIPKLYLSAQATYQSDAANMSDLWADIGNENITQLLNQFIPELGMSKFQGKVQLDIQQNIWDGGKSTAEKRIAKAEARANAASVDVEMYQLESRVDNIYFGILLLDEQLAQMEDLHELLGSNLKNAQALLRNNLVLQSDVDAIEAEYLSNGQKIEQIRYSRSAFRKMLSLLVGKDVTGETLAEPEELGASLMKEKERPEITLINEKKNLLSEQIRNIRTYSMPQFSAFASGWYGYPTLNMFKAMKDSKWGLDGVVGVKMSWSIGAYYTQGNRIKILQLNQQQLDLQKDVFLYNQKLQTIQENSEIIRLNKVLKDDDRIVTLRQSVRQAAESQYRNGTITTNELLQHLMDESNARRAKSIHHIELLKTEYELQHTL